MKFALVVAKFNDFVTDRLQAGALEALKSAGVATDDVCVIKVPGAFEIPFAAKEAASRGQFAAVVCLGCLIRGATPHFEYIASACAHGITEAAAATGVPMTFGVLTTNSVEEALERAADGSGQQRLGGGGCRRRNGDAAACAAPAPAGKRHQRMSSPPDTSPSGTRHRTTAPRAAGGRADAVSVGSRAAGYRRSAADVLERQSPGSDGAPEAVRTFAEQLVRSTIANVEKIDPIIAETAEHWRLSRMAALDRLILRLAIGEFLDGSTPRNVVINEALELAKTFSGDESAKFVNGILDAVKKKLQ